MSSSNETEHATELPLPKSHFYSIEYPGYVQPSSISQAIRNLGGQGRIDNVFHRGTAKDAILELSFRPDSLFSHPVPGATVSTNNLLLKVTRRRRKKRSGDPLEDPLVGEYKAEVIGTTSRTVRFRSMIDFQYEPDANDPVSQLRQSMKQMDVDAIHGYMIPTNLEQHMTELGSPLTTSDSIDPVLSEPSRTESQSLPGLRLFPPPVFSRQTVPLQYNFRANTASIATTVVDEKTGEVKKRLINRMRWKGYGPASILFSDAEVPEKPLPAVENERSQVNQTLLAKLVERFNERPIWTRMALFNRFTSAEAREILNSKPLLPLVCYVFQDGPWRDTLVRFKYDPRKDPGARIYQRLYFRNANHPMSRPSVVTRRQDRTSSTLATRTTAEQSEHESERRNSHIFDGQTIPKETAAFQLCDIHDPMLKAMIEDPEALRDECHERDGWYTSHALEQIKTVLRHKFFSLLDGHIPTDEECRALLTNHGASTKASVASRAQRLRTGKHNMAKGALRPEDAAALRLRAALDRKAKSRLTGADEDAA